MSENSCSVRKMEDGKGTLVSSKISKIETPLCQNNASCLENGKEKPDDSSNFYQSRKREEVPAFLRVIDACASRAVEPCRNMIF